jgi:hypothetical protein
MEPASSPDNARSARGPSRFWSGNGTPDQAPDGDVGSDSSDLSAWVSALSDDTEMVALGSRAETPVSPGPGHPEPAPQDPQPAEPVAGGAEPARANPWNRDSGTFGGFGLSGRNGRFLTGGRDTGEGRPGLNGRTPELNGDQPDLPGSSPADPMNPAADAAHQNGRDEMNGRAEVPGYPTTGETDPGEAGSPPRRPPTGWASVPTSTNPVVEPVPGSDDPISGVPVSPAHQAFPYGQAPSSGVPAPRAPGQVSPPAFPSTFPPAPSFTPDVPAAPVAGRGSATVPPPAPAPTPVFTEPDNPAPVSPAVVSPPEPEAVPTADLRTADEGITLGGRRSREDDSTSPTAAQRRSASLEDAEPVRRGRRAAPDDDDAQDEPGMRPGDVAAGHITFWDDDATRHFREAWHEVKAEFVDDPVTALTRAHDLLTDAVNELTEALLAERDELDPLRSTATPDTESMRMAMRGYREFLDRILAL